LVAAAAPGIPRALLDQLADGGRLVAPVARERGQMLVRVTRHGDGYQSDDLGSARFVPLIGRHGFPSEKA
jgi:protein-L-isoaspartate(D-aspartate) O-methyltransferase